MMNEAQSVDGMTCEACTVACQRFGRHRNGLRRFRCPQRLKTYTEAHNRVLDTMYISQDRAVLALQLLLEGNSIRSTERITGMDRNTIMSLVVKAGERCKTLMVSKVVNLLVSDVQADEIWGFVEKKEGHKLDDEKNALGIGDAYCFVGIERHTKMILAWHLGKRDPAFDGCVYRQVESYASRQPIPVEHRWIQALCQRGQDVPEGHCGLRTVGQDLFSAA